MRLALIAVGRRGAEKGAGGTEQEEEEGNEVDGFLHVYNPRSVGWEGIAPWQGASRHSWSEFRLTPSQGVLINRGHRSGVSGFWLQAFGFSVPPSVQRPASSDPYYQRLKLKGPHTGLM